ncbi:unnamed protein product [Amoebophrya sp. A25]|nr:unnamed protein product [Amoebophrya sp. A25]|eukprot:GSA25T00020686001.1
MPGNFKVKPCIQVFPTSPTGCFFPHYLIGTRRSPRLLVPSTSTTRGWWWLSWMRHITTTNTTNNTTPLTTSSSLESLKVILDTYNSIKTRTIMTASSSSDVRVVTYNVLSPLLADISSHTQCTLENLQADTRLARIKQKLEGEIGTKKPIVCLQEVGLSWKGPLFSFFDEAGYKVIDTHYGNQYADYMGILVAYPADRYRCTKTDTARVSDIFQQKIPEEEGQEKRRQGGGGAGIKGALAKLGAEVMAKFVKRESAPKPEESGWEIAERRQNRIILAAFESLSTEKKQAFALATYHNPCLFGSKEKVRALAIHSTWIAQALEKFAEGKPRILCGDFNFTPKNSLVYYYMTTGSAEVAERLDFQRGKGAKYSDWDSKLQPMGSAYAEYSRSTTSETAAPTDVKLVVDSTDSSSSSASDGVETPHADAIKSAESMEPRYTNYASRRDPEGDDFMETLDYVFYGPKSAWTVKDIVKLPSEEEGKKIGVCPNEREPSDHLLLGATFSLK